MIHVSWRNFRITVLAICVMSLLFLLRDEIYNGLIDQHQCAFPRYLSSTQQSSDDWALLDGKGINMAVEEAPTDQIATITIFLESKDALIIRQESPFANPKSYSAKKETREGLDETSFVITVLKKTGQGKSIAVSFWTFKCGSKTWIKFREGNPKLQKS